MSSQTDILDDEVISGNLSVIPGVNGNGDIKVQGKIYTNNIDENTTDFGVSIQQFKFKNNTLEIFGTQEPSVLNLPNSNASQLFYLDENDNNLLKSIDSNSKITTYQPLTTKGDILIHNGTKQSRLPVGLSNQILSVNLSNPTGLEWVDNLATTKPSILNSSKQINLNGNNQYVILSNNTYGAYFILITPYVYDGASGNFFITKSNITGGFNLTVLNNNNSTVNNNTFDIRWQTYRNIELTKKYTEADGIYQYASNFSFFKYRIDLQNNVGYQLNNEFFSQIGAYFISIYPEVPGGPCMNLFLIKSYATLNTGLLSIVNTSSGTAGNSFNITWPSNSVPSISKTNNNNNGFYIIKNNFEDETFKTEVSLSNTISSIIPFQIYDKCSLICKITSNILNAPMAIFTISKNRFNINGNITRFSSPGLLGTNLNLSWNTNSGITLSKTDNNYNGIYKIDFTCL